MTDTCREAFEYWYSDSGAYRKAVEREGDGYVLMQADQAWNAWQAAWEAKPEAMLKNASILNTSQKHGNSLADNKALEVARNELADMPHTEENVHKHIHLRGWIEGYEAALQPAAPMEGLSGAITLADEMKADGIKGVLGPKYAHALTIILEAARRELARQEEK